MPFSPFKNLSRLICTLLLSALLVTAADSGPAHAQAPSISPRAHEALTEVQTLLQDSRWAEADVALRRFIENFSRESYAVATAWQMRGYLLSETGKHEEALRAYEQALDLGGLDVASAQHVRYNIAQILMSLGRHAEAVKRIDAWLAHSDALTAPQRVQAAWIYLGAEKYERAARLLEEAIRETVDAAESWYQLLIAALQGAEDHLGLKKWLPLAIERFPQEKRYWQHLSSVYFQLKEDRRAVATLSAAYHNGLLSEEVDLLHLVRFYLFAGMPHKASRVLEEAIEKGQIAESAVHYELLADGWVQAQEISRAIETLQEALQRGAGFETSLKIGQLQIQQEDWHGAREHLQKAAQSPQERPRGEALLLLGMAAYYSGDAAAAHRALVQALEYSTVRRQAENWLALLHSNPPAPET